MEHKDSLPHLQEPVNSPNPEPDQPSPFTPSHSLRIHFNIILSFTPGTSKWYISPTFPHENPTCTYLLLHTCYMLRLPYFSRFITRIILDEYYRSLNTPLCIFLHSCLTSSLLDPNILLSTLFSNTLSLSSSLNESDKFRNLIKHLWIHYFVSGLVIMTE